MRTVLSKLKIITLLAATLAAFFVVSGYLLSDDLYFNRLIEANRIDSPERAFQYVNENIEFVFGNPVPVPYATPRYMLRKKSLWCDEGAILLATIVHELGYETRLVDVIKADGRANHTYLQIRQNGDWKNYDTVLKKSNLTHEQILEGYPGMKGYARPRPYPRFYNWITQNNFYLQRLALWLRGAPAE